MQAKLHPFLVLLVLTGGCTATATSWFPDAGDGGSSLIADPKTDAGKKKDSGTTEDGGDEDDAGETEDAGKVDSGKKDGSVITPTCQPESIGGFSPTWKAPKPIHSSACTAANAQMVIDCNFDPAANQTTCDAFLNNTANSACISCVLTDVSSTQYGPVIVDGTTGRLNLAGCVAALSGNTTSTGCGAKVSAWQQCGDVACASCPDQTDPEYEQCITDADTTECSTYATNAACADTLIDTGGVAQACVAGSTFVDRARSIAKIFCSP